MALLAGLKPDLELFDALSIDVALVHLFVIDIACLSKKESSFHYCGFGGFLLCMPMSGKGAVVEPLRRGCLLKCPLQIHALDKTALLPEGISIRAEPLLWRKAAYQRARISPRQMNLFSSGFPL